MNKQFMLDGGGHLQQVLFGFQYRMHIAFRDFTLIALVVSACDVNADAFHDLCEGRDVSILEEDLKCAPIRGSTFSTPHGDAEQLRVALIHI